MDEQSFSDEGSSSLLLRLAAFLMTFGSGTAVSFYMAMSGFYIQRIRSESFYISMCLWVVLPMPLISFLQGRYDAWFDTKFSTPVMYAFRVIVMQLILAAVTLVWMLGPSSWWIVLVIGSVIGLIANAITSSSLQLVAAIGPEHIINAKMGLQVGGLMPICIFQWSDFQPWASDAEFRTILMWVVGICLLAATFLAYMNWTRHIFAKAYRRLSYDLPDHEEAQPLNSDGCLEDSEFSRQQSLTVPLNPEIAKQGVPSWIVYWQCCSFLSMAASFALVSMAGFFGDPRMAQTLSLLKLGMDLCGRILALAIPSLPGFTHGPFHTMIVFCVALVLGFAGLCFARVLGAAYSTTIFIGSWCLVFILTIWINALLDVTSGAYVEVRDRKSVARVNQLVVTSAMLFGLLGSEAISRMLHRG